MRAPFLSNLKTWAYRVTGPQKSGSVNRGNRNFDDNGAGLSNSSGNPSVLRVLGVVSFNTFMLIIEESGAGSLLNMPMPNFFDSDQSCQLDGE